MKFISASTKNMSQTIELSLSATSWECVKRAYSCIRLYNIPFSMLLFCGDISFAF